MVVVLVVVVIMALVGGCMLTQKLIVKLADLSVADAIR